MDFSSFKNIEDQFETHKIKFMGIGIWLYLRIYAFDRININTSSGLHNASTSLFKQLFWSFPKLGRKKYIVFSSTDQRKFIDGKWYDRQDFSEELKNQALFVESPTKPHKPKDEMASSFFLSKLWFYAIELVISKFVRVNFEGELTLKDILKALNCSLNEISLLKRFKAQYLVSRFALKYYKTEALILTTPYTNMARILAAKNLGIKVIEFQHGLISRKHNAYAIGNQKVEILQPDWLLSFGENEKKVLAANDYLPENKVLPIGSFYLGHLQEKLEGHHNPIKKENPNKKIVCFTAQDLELDEVIKTLNELASDEEQIVVFLPRKMSIEAYYKLGLSNKVKYYSEFDTYQTLMYSDIHLTLFSTCATEAIALGTPSILLNFGGHAEKHFSDLAAQLKYLTIVSDAVSLKSELNAYSNYDVIEVSESVNHLYKRGYKKNLNLALKHILGEGFA